jgi:mannosyltransferase OCH1-like enzyme
MKITKVLIQTNRLNPPDYLVKMNMRLNQDWKYEFYSDEDALEFIINNPIEEFNESQNIFKSFKSGSHKSDFFRYYYLYLKGGVYIDSDFLLKSNLNDIGKTFKILIESHSKRDVNDWTGRTSQNKITVFPKSADYQKPGDYVWVKIHDCTRATLLGTIVDQP